MTVSTGQGAQGGVQHSAQPTNLADVVEVILDKGIVIDAYVRVSLVGIELLTIDARIVVASIDTYLHYAREVRRLGLYDDDQTKGLPGVLGGDKGAELPGKGAEQSRQGAELPGKGAGQQGQAELESADDRSDQPADDRDEREAARPQRGRSAEKRSTRRRPTQRRSTETQRQEKQSRDAKRQDTQPRDTQPRDTQSRDTQSRDTQSRDTQSRDAPSRDAPSRDAPSRDTNKRRSVPRSRTPRRRNGEGSEG